MRILIALCLLAPLALASPARAEGSITGAVTATPERYLTDTVVFIKEAKVPAAPKTVYMDQKGMKFVPHILLAVAGDTVSYLNHDSVAHNVMSPDHGGFNLGNFKAGESKKRTFETPGAWVQMCQLHPEMLGYVFVGQNPFMAVVDEKGAFTLSGVPGGKYELSIWNPKLGAESQTVTVADGAAAHASFQLKRGGGTK